MIIGIPKEVKDNEYRVSLPPGGARELTRRGHHVVVETKAGFGSGFTDDEYIQAGATIAGSAADVWQQANMIVKVKEPLPSEYPFLRDDLILFTYLHLAASEDLTRALVASGVTGIAYETVETTGGHLPLLQPMSEVAGRMATQIAALSPLASRYERTFDPIVLTDEEMHASLAADDYLLRNAISSGIRIMGDPGLVPS